MWWVWLSRIMNIHFFSKSTVFPVPWWWWIAGARGHTGQCLMCLSLPFRLTEKCVLCKHCIAWCWSCSFPSVPKGRWGSSASLEWEISSYLAQMCQTVALQLCWRARIVNRSVGWEPPGLLSWVLSNPIWVLFQSSYAQASAEAGPRMCQSRGVMQPISRSVTASAMISWCCEAWNSICFLCYSYQMVCPS